MRVAGYGALLTGRKLGCVRFSAVDVSHCSPSVEAACTPKDERAGRAEGHDGRSIEGRVVVLVDWRVVLGRHVLGMDHILGVRASAPSCMHRHFHDSAEPRLTHLDRNTHAVQRTSLLRWERIQCSRTLQHELAVEERPAPPYAPPSTPALPMARHRLTMPSPPAHEPRRDPATPSHCQRSLSATHAGVWHGADGAH